MTNACVEACAEVCVASASELARERRVRVEL